MTTSPLITAEFLSPLGPLVAAATADGICLLEFADRRALATERRDLERRYAAPFTPGRSDHLDRLADELAAYFAGELAAFTVLLALHGTPFQRAVWDRLLAIPYARTTSYDGIARELGKPGAQRAVGRANGQNRVAILVPCHRVIEKNGALRGYGGGLHRKQFLLDLERNSRHAPVGRAPAAAPHAPEPQQLFPWSVTPDSGGPRPSRAPITPGRSTALRTTL